MGQGVAMITTDMMIFTSDPAALDEQVDCGTCGKPTTREDVSQVEGMHAWICRHPGCTHSRGEDGQPSVDGKPGRGGRGGKPPMQRIVILPGTTASAIFGPGEGNKV